jgi:hypothetical protein
MASAVRMAAAAIFRRPRRSRCGFEVLKDLGVMFMLAVFAAWLAAYYTAIGRATVPHTIHVPGPDSMVYCSDLIL